MMQKTVGQMAKLIRELIPQDSLDGYTLKPVLGSIACEKSIQRGVYAFKEFLTKLYDRLIMDSGLYDKPTIQQKTEDSGHDHAVSLAVGCPFINYMTSILINIGYCGDLIENNASIIFNDWNSLTSVVGPQGGPTKQTIPVLKVVEVLRFLATCGLGVSGIDLDAKKTDLSKLDSLRIFYPENPAMLTGLKVMAVVHNELSTKNDYYVFQRCDYRLLRTEAPVPGDYLRDYVHLLTDDVKSFILELHRQCLSEGLSCSMKMHYFGVIFSYIYKSNIVWEFIPSPDGCYIVTKAKNMAKYVDDIENFPKVLQDKISKGYGCEKKRFGKPCQKGCHGFSFPLDESILDIRPDIEMWLHKEMSCLQRI